MSDSAKPVGRPMKYPYTYSAKIAQFPYKFYFQNSWLARYWVFGMVAVFPLFYKIHKAGKLNVIYLMPFNIQNSIEN